MGRRARRFFMARRHIIEKRHAHQSNELAQSSRDLIRRSLSPVFSLCAVFCSIIRR